MHVRSTWPTSFCSEVYMHTYREIFWGFDPQDIIKFLSSLFFPWTQLNFFIIPLWTNLNTKDTLRLAPYIYSYATKITLLVKTNMQRLTKTLLFVVSPICLLHLSALFATYHGQSIEISSKVRWKYHRNRKWIKLYTFPWK